MRQSFFSLGMCLSLFTTVISCGERPRPTLENASASTTVKDNLYRTGFMLMEGEVQEVRYVAVGDMAHIAEDVIVPREQIAASPAQLNLTIEKGAKLWPGGVVPIKYDPRIPREMLRHAAAEYAKAGLTLVPHSNQKNFVDIRVVSCIKDDDGKCGTALGQSLGGIGFNPNQTRHVIEVSNEIVQQHNSANTPFDPTLVHPFSRALVRNLLHEIGHAVGCRHEHAHPDTYKKLKPTRDAIIDEVELERVQAENDRLAKQEITTAMTEFDFDSIMLYCDYYARKTPRNQSEMRRAIQNLEPEPICDPFSKPTNLSMKDVEGLKTLYQDEVIKKKLAEDTSDAGFYGFTTGGKFKTAVLTDGDSCQFGSLPAPDGMVKLVAYGKDNQGMVVESTRNYTSRHPVGSVVSIGTWLGGLSKRPNNTMAHHPGNSNCNNANGQAVNVTLSDKVPGGPEYAFIGFTTGGKFKFATLIDADGCSFGPLPAPDGIVKIEAHGADNQGIVIESTRNYASRYPVGTIVPLSSWSFPRTPSNTLKQLGPSGCGNPTGYAVRLELSN